MKCFNPHPIRRPDAAQARRQRGPGQGGFNPHPIRRPDAASGLSRASCQTSCFNPHPIRRPDAADRTHADRGGVGVSILIRSVDRMQLSTESLSPLQCGFQSSSDPKTGCSSPARHGAGTCRPCFNPHPIRRPDAAWIAGAVRSSESSFQSSSDPKTGCSSGGLTVWLNVYMFQSSSDPKTGCSRDAVAVQP